jgi:predicted DCC family thiol-disulfide oxidoreductase YuxK
VVGEDGELTRKSRAVGAVLERLGGVWLVLGLMLQATPRRVADFGYDVVGHSRHRLAGRLQAGVCALLSPRLAARMLP